MIREALFLTGVTCILTSVAMSVACSLSTRGKLIFSLIIIVALASSISAGLQLRHRSDICDLS